MGHERQDVVVSIAQGVQARALPSGRSAQRAPLTARINCPNRGTRAGERKAVNAYTLMGPCGGGGER